MGNSAIDRRFDNLWYAFVDLREGDQSWAPEVFLVPSSWVDDFVKPEYPRKMYLLKAAAEPLCRERWDMIDKFFANDPEVIQWAHEVPDLAK